MNGSPNDEGLKFTPLNIVSLGAQSFAIFIGLSILLGRVYLILYTKKLGIPVSSINIGPIDHAIFSPDIAIMSVSIAISISLLLVLATSIAPRWSPLRQGSVQTLSQVKWVIIALILGVVLGVLMVYIPAFILTGPRLLPVGVRGSVTALGVIIGSLGLIGLTLSLTAKLTGARAAAAQYVGYAIVLLMLVASLSWSIVGFASDDAFKDVTESPTAELEVAPMEAPKELRRSTSARADTLVLVNVVYINDKFTFVVDSSEAESVKNTKGIISLKRARRAVKGALPIYAIPNESIRRIKYIFE